jgi:hypothetical protein
MPISPMVLVRRSSRPSAGTRRIISEPSTPSSIAATAASSRPERGNSERLWAS